MARITADSITRRFSVSSPLSSGRAESCSACESCAPQEQRGPRLSDGSNGSLKADMDIPYLLIWASFCIKHANAFSRHFEGIDDLIARNWCEAPRVAPIESRLPR